MSHFSSSACNNTHRCGMAAHQLHACCSAMATFLELVKLTLNTGGAASQLTQVCKPDLCRSTIAFPTFLLLLLMLCACSRQHHMHRVCAQRGRRGHSQHHCAGP